MVVELHSPKSQHLVLRQANDEQIIQIWKNIRIIWGQGLNEVEYIKREQLLSLQEFSLKNLHFYVLMPKYTIDELCFLSQLETFKRKAYFNHPKLGFKKVNLHLIASIFTPEKFRGQGFATIIFDMLLPTLAKYGYFASILYSDIGPFYEKFGYKLYSPYQLEINCNSCNIKLNDNISYLNEQHIEKLALWDCLKLEREVASMPLNKLPYSGAFAIEPSIDGYKWHWTASKFHALRKGITISNIFGAIYEHEENPQFIIWNYDFIQGELIILRHRITNQASNLLYYAIDKAKQLGLSKVVAWNLPLELIKDKQLRDSCQWIRRNDSLPYALFPQLKRGLPEPHWFEVQRYSWA